MTRRFTRDQAEALLPQVGRLIREAVSIKAEYDEAEAVLQNLMQKVMVQGGMMVDRERVVQDKSRRERLGERLKAAIEAVQEQGCLIKDLDIGLVDFPTLFRGREVYLCWKMDEARITHWHGTDEGFAGRKRIDQDFLDNHRGDAAH